LRVQFKCMRNDIYIFILLKQAHFSENMLECDFTRTQSVVFIRSGVISSCISVNLIRSSVIYTRIVRFSHANVILTGMSVIFTLTSVI
jgi:hypothetical protein